MPFLRLRNRLPDLRRALPHPGGHEAKYVKIDHEACVACGICIYRCPNDNIEMVATELSPKNSSLAGKPKIIKNPAKIKIWNIHG